MQKKLIYVLFVCTVTFITSFSMMVESQSIKPFRRPNVMFHPQKQVLSAIVHGSKPSQIIPLTYLSLNPTNLLHNSSFEQESNGQPRDWNYQLDSTTANTFISQEGNRSGIFGLKFFGGSVGNFGISQPNVKTVPGRIYTFYGHILTVAHPYSFCS